MIPNPTVGYLQKAIKDSKSNLSMELMGALRNDILSSRYTVEFANTEGLLRILFWSEGNNSLSGPIPMFAIYLEKKEDMGGGREDFMQNEDNSVTVDSKFFTRLSPFILNCIAEHPKMFFFEGWNGKIRVKKEELE